MTAPAVDAPHPPPSHAADASRPPFLPRTFTFVTLLLLLVCAHFALLRAGLLIRNHASATTATAGQLATAFLVGLRFDFATACYLLTPFAIAAHLPRVGPVASPRARRRFLITFLAVIAPLTFLALAEYEFFHEFQTRYNQLAFQYLNDPRTVGGMLWYSYPVIRYTLLWLACTALIALPVAWLLRRCFPPQPTPPHPTSPTRQVVSIVLLSATFIIGMRGGLQGEPLRWGDAYRTDNEFANELALNGLYTLGRTALESLRHHKSTSAWAKSMPPSDARHIAADMILDPADPRPPASRPTVLRTSTDTDDWLQLNPTQRPVNVVLVLMESFSARFVGAAGAPGNFTPHFDALARDGVLFTRFFSSGTHTHQGVFSTLLGFPNLPAHEYLMQDTSSNQPFCSLPSLFKQSGYQTLFLYNGDFAWDNMRGFFRKQGIDRFVGGPDFPNSVHKDRVWGVADKDLFDRASAEFQQAAAKGPFFGVILTLSNHAPFDLPQPLPFSPTTNMGDLNKRLDGVRYADWSLGQFIAKAKSLPYFRDTLFVFVGDHGFHVEPKLTDVNLLFHHVPLLFYSPNLLPQHDIRSPIVAGQTSIAPTIAALTRLTPPVSHWGRNLFGHPDDGAHFAIFKGSGGDPATAIAQDDHLLVIGPDNKPTLYHYDLSFPPTATPTQDPTLQHTLETQLRAYIQASLQDLTARQAALPSPGTERLTP